MNTPLLAAQRFFGGFGIFDLAMRVAERRAGVIGFWTEHKLDPASRANANPAMHPVSMAYYQIIDRISRGEKP